jgi:hypothetical protein
MTTAERGDGGVKALVNCYIDEALAPVRRRLSLTIQPIDRGHTGPAFINEQEGESPRQAVQIFSNVRLTFGYIGPRFPAAVFIAPSTWDGAELFIDP